MEGATLAREGVVRPEEAVERGGTMREGAEVGELEEQMEVEAGGMEEGSWELPGRRQAGR